MGESEGRHLAKRYVELRNDFKNSHSKEEEKTGDEIAQDIISRNGLIINGCI